MAGNYTAAAVEHVACSKTVCAKEHGGHAK